MSYELVDAIGIPSIAAIIKQSGLQKISIVKYGSGKGTLPVFEDNDSKTNDRILKGFTDWATSILHGNPFNDMVYEVVLYNEPIKEDPDEATEDKKNEKRGYGRANKSKFNIQLYRHGQGETEKGKISDRATVIHEQPMGTDKMQEIFKTMFLENELVRRLTAAEQEIKTLHTRIDELTAELDELGDDLETVSANNAQAITPEPAENKYLDKIIDMLNVKAANKGATINGPDEVNEGKVVIENVNKAFKILYKYDKKIDIHLLKFAALAEKDLDLYNKIVDQLEKM